MHAKLNELLNIASEIVLDKRQELELALTCLLAGGHLLIEDVPGVGKTTMVQTISKLSGLDVCRIQFTVDLLPADILGGQIFNAKDQKFEFHPGPIFHQMILADELNRASPRTQSALLQAMEEQTASIDGVTHSLPKPFFVIATQNPHQQTGTFPLPDSQLDRFLISLEMNYASKETETLLFQGIDPRNKIDKLTPLFQANDFINLREKVDKIHVSKNVAEYVSRLLQQSREHLKEGNPLSTRAGLNLIRAAKAWAFLNQRDYLLPDDIQKILIPVCGHRLGGQNGLKKGRDLARNLQKTTPVPT